MRPWIAGAAAVAVATLIFALPRYTASETEAYRQRQLHESGALTPLPPCPVGDALDSLLNRVQSDRTALPLWIPACREQPPAAGHIVVFEASRDRFQACRQQLASQRNAECWLEEKLAFLASASSPRSIARAKVLDSDGRPVVWVTSHSLAWGSSLVAQHRLYLMLMLSTLGICGFAGRRTRSTYRALHAMRVSGPAPPIWTEFWLMFVLPPYAQSLPVDFRDEFEELIESNGSDFAARWYRANVYGSLRDLIIMRLRWILPFGSRATR